MAGYRDWGGAKPHLGWIRVVTPTTLPCVSLWGCPQSQSSLVLEVSSLTQSHNEPSSLSSGDG